MGVAAQSRDLLLVKEDTLTFIWTLTFLMLALIAPVLGFTELRRDWQPSRQALVCQLCIRVRRQPDHRASRIERVARTLVAAQ